MPAGVHEDEILPESSFYVLHPCLNGKIQPIVESKYQEDFINGIFIAGDGLPCPSSCRPKVIIFNETGSIDIQIAYFPEGTSNFSALNANIIDGLEIEKAAYPFVVTLLMALKKTDSENFSVDSGEIGTQAGYLRENKFIDKLYGHGKYHGEKTEPRKIAEDYYRTTLDITSTDQKPGYFSPAKFFLWERLGNTELKTRQNNDGKLDYYVRGLKKGDILILLRTKSRLTC